jgi:hypothetical protein
VAVLGLSCIFALLRRLKNANGRSGTRETRRPILLSLASAIFLLLVATAFFCALIVLCVQTYVDRHDPSAQSTSATRMPANELANICCVLAAFVADGLLVSCPTGYSLSLAEPSIARSAMAWLHHLEQKFAGHSRAVLVLCRRLLWVVYPSIKALLMLTTGMSVLYIYGIVNPDTKPFNDPSVYIFYGAMLVVGG